MKKIALAVVGLGILVALALVGTYGLAANFVSSRLARQWEAPVPEVTYSTDPEVLARGEHLARFVMLCSGCHGDDMGGMDPYIDATGILTVNTPNLTSGKGGVIQDYSASDMARVVRFGVRPDGTAASIMPTKNYGGISEADLAAVVSYVQTIAPVDRTVPPSIYKPMGRVLWFAGVMELQGIADFDWDAPIPKTTPTEPKALGAYLARLSGCVDCHGAAGSGGPMPGAPPDMAIPRNLTPHESGLKGWTRAEFGFAVRAGQSKDGTRLDPMMPWKSYAGMTPAEIDAMWEYYQGLEPREFGNR